MGEFMRMRVALFLILAISMASAAALAQTKPPVPATTATGYFSLARDAFQKGDLDAVEFNCRMALTLKPDFLDAHYMIGKAYLLRAAKANRLAVRDYGTGSAETRYVKQYIKGRADLAKAINHFQTAVNLEPRDIEALLNLAISQDNYGKEEEAIKSYEKVIATDPASTHSRDAYNNLGLLYVSQKEYKKAKKSYEKSLGIDSSFAPARLNLQRLETLKPRLK
jgi:protein O-GlcNAc transferase